VERDRRTGSLVTDNAGLDGLSPWRVTSHKSIERTICPAFRTTTRWRDRKPARFFRVRTAPPGASTRSATASLYNEFRLTRIFRLAKFAALTSMDLSRRERGRDTHTRRARGALTRWCKLIPFSAPSAPPFRDRDQGTTCGASRARASRAPREKRTVALPISRISSSRLLERSNDAWLGWWSVEDVRVSGGARFNRRTIRQQCQPFSVAAVEMFTPTRARWFLARSRLLGGSDCWMRLTRAPAGVVCAVRRELAKVGRDVGLLLGGLDPAGACAGGFTVVAEREVEPATLGGE
jgi:hypothetical protein